MYDFYVFFPGSSLSPEPRPTSPDISQVSSRSPASRCTHCWCFYWYKHMRLASWLQKCTSPTCHSSKPLPFEAICHSIPFWHPKLPHGNRRICQKCFQHGKPVWLLGHGTSCSCLRPFFLLVSAGPTGLMELFKQVDQWRKIRPNEESTESSESTQKNISQCFWLKAQQCIPAFQGFDNLRGERRLQDHGNSSFIHCAGRVMTS